MNNAVVFLLRLSQIIIMIEEKEKEREVDENKKGR